MRYYQTQGERIEEIDKMALPSTLMLVSLAIQAASALDVNTRCKSSIFEPLLDANATIETVDIVSTGDEYGEGAVNLGYPINPTNLPELCAVIVKVESSSNSSFRFGLFLPTEWNSRVLTVGNGGFAGGINWLDMGPGKHIHLFFTYSCYLPNKTVRRLTPRVCDCIYGYGPQFHHHRVELGPG